MPLYEFIDDDVWLNQYAIRSILSFFRSDAVGAVGPAGGFMTPSWESFQPALLMHKSEVNEEVDEVTGYCWACRAALIVGVRFNKDKFFWHEETDIQWRIKEKSYKILICENVAYHACQRDPKTTDWNMLRKSWDMLKNEWFHKRESLDLMYMRDKLPEPLALLEWERREHPEKFEKPVVADVEPLTKTETNVLKLLKKGKDEE